MLHLSFFKYRKLKKSSGNVSSGVKHFFPLFFEFIAFFSKYLKNKVLEVSHGFEHQKNFMVKFFMMKRGRYNRAFLHITAISLVGIGVIFAPILAETYPMFAPASTAHVVIGNANAQESISMDNDVFQTQISQKPRELVTTYTVQKGDTVSTIAKKFGISADTVRWANNLSNDNITVGDDLKIPSVTGILHKVASGDTVYSIAKKYDTSPQGIVDFPYNDFANPQTFSLVVGEIVMVPDGVKPEDQPTYVKPTRFLAAQPSAVGASGYAWPVHGPLSQGYSWYHTALDIESPVGTPVMSAQTGTVLAVYPTGWNAGYGTHVLVKGNDGNVTLYAHMSGINVSVGQSVVAGQTMVGWVGLTGHTTGPHLHFEVKGANPLSYLP